MEVSVSTGRSPPRPASYFTNNNNDMDILSVNTIRTIAIDAVQAASSGHPGTPMALAPVVYCLWQQFLRFDPQDPIWPNRDRFVLSVGHASLLYSLLHLTGVKAVSKDYESLGELSVPLEAVRRFRQLDSRCSGHPEYRWTSGVETTSCHAIGMSSFGASAPLNDLKKNSGFTADRIVECAQEQIRSQKSKS